MAIDTLVKCMFSFAHVPSIRATSFTSDQTNYTTNWDLQLKCPIVEYEISRLMVVSEVTRSHVKQPQAEH